MNATEFAEQVYAILNIGGAVKLPNSTKAVLAERFSTFAASETAAKEAAEQRAEEFKDAAYRLENTIGLLRTESAEWERQAGAMVADLAAAEAERDWANREAKRAEAAEQLAGILGLKLDTANRTADELLAKLLAAEAVMSPVPVPAPTKLMVSYDGAEPHEKSPDCREAGCIPYEAVPAPKGETR